MHELSNTTADSAPFLYRILPKGFPSRPSSQSEDANENAAILTRRPPRTQVHQQPEAPRGGQAFATAGSERASPAPSACPPNRGEDTKGVRGLGCHKLRCFFLLSSHWTSHETTRDRSWLGTVALEKLGLRLEQAPHSPAGLLKTAPRAPQSPRSGFPGPGVGLGSARLTGIEVMLC